jgi:hypothetical protein
MKAKWFTTLLVVMMLVIAVVPSAGAAQSAPTPDKITVSKFGTISCVQNGPDARHKFQTDPSLQKVPRIS